MPRVLSETPQVRAEQLIGEEDTPRFSITRYGINNGTLTLEQPASIWICTQGTGTVTAEGFSRTLNKGVYFFLPAAATDHCQVTGDILEVVCCQGGK